MVDNLFSTYMLPATLLIRVIKYCLYIVSIRSRLKWLTGLGGYKKAIKKANWKPVLKKWFFSRRETDNKSHLSILDEHKETDAFCLGLITWVPAGLSDQGVGVLRLPQDLALISFDDYEVFELCNPPVTAIAQPHWWYCRSGDHHIIKQAEHISRKRYQTAYYITYTLRIRNLPNK